MKKILLASALLCCLNFSFAQSATLDPTFGTRGIAKTDMGSFYSYNTSVKQVLLQPDGKLVLVLNGSFPGSVVSKRLANGAIDSTFGVNGYAASIGVTDAFAALQPDGKIVVTGTAGNTSFVTGRLLPNGSPDSTFGTNGIATTVFATESYSKSVAVQADGKIVVAGYTNEDQNSFIIVARYNSNGSLDNTFNGTGVARTDFGYKTPPEHANEDSVETHNSFAYAVAVQADGKIIAAGYANTIYGSDFAVARYKTNGTPDSSFGVNGKQTTNFGSLDIVYSIALQADGKIVLGGYTYDGNTNIFAIARYNTNGSPDNSFSGDGQETINVSSDMQIGNSIALQSTGKIVMAGYTINGDYNDFAIVRLTANGTMDNSFDTDGILTTDFVSSDDYAGSVAIQSDDKIVVAGYSYVYGDNTLLQIAVARYNVNGSADNTFADNGKLSGESKQGSTYYNATAIQPNGKIVAAGRTWNGTNYDFAVVRYNTNGSLDNTFSSDGKQTTDLGGFDEANSVAIQTDGKILVAGTVDMQFAIARYNADGTLDNTFSGDGKLVAPMAFADELRSIALQSDGKIVAAGSSYTDNNYDSAYFVVARFNSNGTIDNTFNGVGKQFTSFDSPSNFGTGVGVQTNGKIVVTGRTYANNQNYFSLARYNADGTLDNTFSTDGKQSDVYGADGYLSQSMAIQNDGKIVMGGYSENSDGTSTSFAVARYLANGNLDNSFAQNGFSSTSLGPGFNFSKAIAINSNGRIAVAGTNNDFAMVLLKSDGTRDSTFGTNGILTTEIGVGTSSIQSVAFWNDKLYASGSAQFPGTFGIVARYTLVEGGPLAVSLLDFKATLQNKAVNLQWQIASEKDLSGFMIQRSADGNSFSTIGYIASKGNSGTKADYATTDLQPLKGMNFYRLKMIDQQGKFTYSKIVLVDLKEGVFSFKVFPNPVQNTLFVNANSENETGVFEIFDGAGKKMKAVSVALSANTSLSIDVSNFARGMYILQLRTETKIETRKFIKQ